MKKKILVILALVLALGASSCGLLAENETVTSIEDYEEILGANGRYRDCNVSYNTIWPYSWSDKTKVESFYYRYYNPWDPNHLGYLRLSFTDQDEYETETERLNQIDSHDYVGRYGITGFSRELCAIIIDDTNGNGMIYALTDREKQEIVYVVIDFCNYFSDIKNYKKVIESENLPDGLDISQNNPARKAFEKAR